MFLGIDIGTSSVKALIMDERGAVVAETSHALTVSRPHPLWSEQNPEDWWQATHAAVGTLERSLRHQIRGFETLDAMETQLSQTRYLTGDTFTEADLRAFPTLARFDVAYHYAFKCNLRKLVDYPNLWAYAREIYAMPGVAETVKFDIYKQGYFSPSELRNPLGIVPLGPELADWHAPHGRDHITL